MLEEYDGRAFTSIVDGKMSCATDYIPPYDSYDDVAKVYQTTINFDGADFSGDFNTDYQTKQKSTNVSYGYWENDRVDYRFSTCVPYDVNMTYHYKFSNPVIRQYNVVLEGTDGVKVNKNSIYKLPMEGVPKSASVTVIKLKFQDGETPDESLVYTKTYTPSGFLIDGVHYDFGEEIVVTRDLYITYDYTSELEGPDLPIPTRENYSFKGWYDATIGGHIVTDPKTLAASILYAQWNTADIITIVRPDGIPIEVEYGSLYTIPEIWDKDEIINARVSFNYNDRSGKVDISEVSTSYTKDGVTDTLTGDKYQCGEVIVATHNMILVADYIETRKAAVFPTPGERPGYEFLGWYTSLLDGGVEYR